jgi:mycothiol synthase
VTALDVALTWRDRLTPDEADRVRGVLDAATAADGLSPVSEAVLLSLRHPGKGEHLLAHAVTDVPQRPTHVYETADTPVIGYANLAGGTGELVVHPGYRRRGVGSALVRALLERVGPGGQLRLWAHGEHPAAALMAREHGFTEARVLWQMGRTLEDPVDEPSWPDGVTLRAFVPGRDEEAFVEVNNRAFAWHPEQGGWTVEQVLQREAQPWFDPAGFLLAVDDEDRLLGFHWTKIHPNRLGEVYVLGVDPAQQGRGLGRALTLAGLRHLRERGMRSVMLYVEGDNAPAIRTYEKLGFQHRDTDVAYSSP